MNLTKFALLCASASLASSAVAADYWFSRGVNGETASRNWSDLNNWSTVATSGDGWNSNKTTVQPASDIANGDTISFGVNSGLNGADTVASAINLDVNAYMGKLVLLNASNLPTGITSSNGSKLFLRAPVQNTTDVNSSPTIFSKVDGGSFTFNTDVTVESAIGTVNGGTSYSNLWNRMYFTAGTTTFAEGTTLSFVKNSTSGGIGDLRFYIGNASSAATQTVVNINAKLVTDAQIVLGASGGTGSFVGKYVIGGSESNQHKGNLIVENYANLVLAKTGGALAVTASRFQVLSGTVTFMGSNQIATTTQLAFAQTSASATPPNATIYLNGFSQQVKNLRFESASWVTSGTTLNPIIDFGSNEAAQTFMFSGFEFGTLISSTTPEKFGLIASKSSLIFRNYDIGEDHIISSVQLSSKLLSTTIEELAGKTWMDFIKFDGYNMNDYEIKEIVNGSNWEYVLVPVPEPATLAGILGGIALAFAFVRRRRA